MHLNNYLVAMQQQQLHPNGYCRPGRECLPSQLSVFLQTDNIEQTQCLDGKIVAAPAAGDHFRKRRLGRIIRNSHGRSRS